MPIVYRNVNGVYQIGYSTVLLPLKQVTGITASSITANTLVLSYTTTNTPDTKYTVTSTPVGAVGSVIGGTSINVTGLTTKVAYTFVVTATRNGVSVVSAPSSSYTML